MVMHIDTSSSGQGGFNAHPLEPLDFEYLPPPPPAESQDPSAPALAPALTAAPQAWLQALPDAPFGPLTVREGGQPVPTLLQDLPPPAAVSTVEPTASAAGLAAARPSASPLEIATLELALADPLNRELVRVHGGALPVLDDGLFTQAQVARYGADLTARLAQLAQANTAVRNLYLQAMDQSAQNLGPGSLGAVFVPGSWGGGDSDPVPDAWRFDAVAFTQAYAQEGLDAAAPLAQRAFAALHGPDALEAWETYHGGDADFTTRGHTLAGSFELTAPSYSDLDGHPNRERMGWTTASLNAGSHALRPLSLNAAPQLHNPQAVWFDANLGWVTPAENVVVKADFLDKAIPIVFVAAMTWATAGAFGVAGGAGVAAGTGVGAAGGVVGAMTAGAAFGAIGGFYSGLVNEGRVDLGGMFRGALTGAVTAGVVKAAGWSDLGVTSEINSQGRQVVTGINYAQRALAVTGQATLQGALQAISGGDFRDGFTAGMAQGLGVEVARGLQLHIDGLKDSGSIDAAQAGALRQFARAAQGAVALLGNPDDPAHAFAMTFVNGLMGDVQEGLNARVAGDTASAVWASAPDETAAETARLERQNEAPTGSAGPSRPEHAAHDQALAQVNARWGVHSGGQPELATGGPDESLRGQQPAEIRIEIVGRRIPYAEQVSEAVGGELYALFTRGMQAATGVLDALEITPLSNVKADIQGYLDARAEQGLSEAEMIVFGALYAASEALFPTSALDFTAGIGKGIAAVGAVVKLQRRADEIAAVVRTETRLIDEQREVANLQRWIDREPLYAPPGQAWIRKPEGASDAAAQLEAGLTRVGLPRPGADYAPHHLVGFGSADRTSQEVFARFGLTPNEAQNGVWLSRELHNLTYGNDYKRWVGEQLQLAGSRDSVFNILQEIAQTVQSGLTPWKP